jgi:hypothetical protein
MKKALWLLPLLALTGCPNPAPPDVVINVHETGTCDYVNTPTGFTAASPGAYVAFGITSIVTPSGVPFNFDPSKIFINSTPHETTLGQGDAFVQYVLGPFAAVPTAIPAGDTHNFNPSAQVGIITEDGDATVAKGIDYQLLYDTSGGGPGVLIVKTNAGQTPYPSVDPCNNMSLF